MADYYSDNADALFERYTAFDFETVHAELLPLVTPGPESRFNGAALFLDSSMAAVPRS